MSALLGTARIEWTRFFRDKVALFSTLLLPIVLVLLIAMSFGGAAPTLSLGVLQQGSSPTADAFVAELRESPAFTVATYSDQLALERDIRMGLVSGGVVVPADTTAVQVLVEQTQTDAGPLMSGVSAAAAGVSTRTTAVEVLSTAVPPARAEAAVDRAIGQVPAVEVQTQTVGTVTQAETNTFATAVPSQLTLFIFLNGLLGAAAMVQARRLGVFRRTMAAPHGVRTYLGGLGLSRVAIAALQAGLLLGLGVLSFRVDFGDPLAVAVLAGLWCIVGAGAGMLLGSLARGEEQAVAIGVPLAIVMGMLGGCMWPLSVVGPVMRAVGHLTPQGWAMDAWTALVDGQGLSGIVTELLVLAGFAVVFWGLALWALRRHARAGGS